MLDALLSLYFRNSPLRNATKRDNLANIRVAEEQTMAWESRMARRIPKVGAAPRLIVSSEPTDTAVVII